MSTSTQSPGREKVKNEGGSLFMGWGYSFICKKCHKEYYVHLGAGGDDGWNLLKDIASGKYGEDMRQGVNTPGLYVSSNLYLYVCDKCHY